MKCSAIHAFVSLIPQILSRNAPHLYPVSRGSRLPPLCTVMVLPLNTYLKGAFRFGMILIRIISKERTLDFIRGEVVELIERLLQTIASLLLFFCIMPLSQKLLETGSIT